ncbi:lectin MVL [Endozoicomonas sp. SM1973]|uniref:Lectin MVL n=1 Tax=Spartinivicinus marinus TaxID=2994442 RepID=A0A853IAM9_9GAMM|nr:mannan-binding protein [Spartinivicinus marinus]MCX4025167.1 hypothetical protein [Spartinivicinus marinus]NYZ69999.1 lectin MVL [Spartinivicinus marinus]
MEIKKIILASLSSTILMLQTNVASALDIKAGPIWNNADAATKCPMATQHYGGWTGNWKTIKPGVMSVCETVEESITSDEYAIQAGPIWNNQDAVNKCSSATQHYGGWTGNWTTIIAGKMSVCETHQKVITEYH